MIKFNNQSSILFEPITQIIYTVDNSDNDKVKNQDSLEVKLMSSNFLDKNKYSGDDRNEVGLRINYGTAVSFRGVNGSSNSFVFGRSYVDKKLDRFDYKNGFPEKNSDLVGNYRMTFLIKTHSSITTLEYLKS